jgi:hypothetical protein
MQGTNILNYFTPIIWEAGHMGSFLENFLSPRSKLLTKYNKAMGILPNHEWGYIDPFLNYFGSDFWKYNGYRTQLAKKYSGIELQEQIATAIFYANLKYSLLEKDHYQMYGNDDLLNPDSYQWDIPLTELTEQANPYMKFHLNQYLGNPITRNRAIFCTFPKSKTWLPFLLLLYKFSNSKRNKELLSSLKNLKNITSLDLDDSFFTHYFTPAPKNAYKFDIYKLIFENDLSQVYELYPDFKFDYFKKTQLALAKDTSIKILEKFDMCYTFRCDDNFTTGNMISMSKF